MDDVKNILNNLVSAVKLGDTNKAHQCLQLLLSDKPNLNASWLGVAKMAMLSGEVALAKQALQLFHPSEQSPIPEKLQQLTLSIETGHIESAFAKASQLAKTNPMQPEINHFLSTVALQLGKTELASQYAERVLEQWPTSGHTWLILVSLKKVTTDCGLLERLSAIESAVVDTSNQASKSSFCSALCKAYFDIGDFERAFTYASQSNEYLNKTQTYSVKEARQNAAYIASQLAHVNDVPQPDRQANNNHPIFIVGLPRSGTSLLEQMLCHHSKVIDGGEFNGMERAARCLTKGLPIGSRAEHFDDNVIEKHLHKIRSAYLQYTHEKYGYSAAVVDKSMNNNRYLWLIKKVFPDSPIIFMKRNLLDTAWSCYRTHFSSGLTWSTSLVNTAEYFSIEEGLSRLWQTTFQSSIFSINYQNLVAQPETVLKELSDFCGLEYEPTMLKFHESNRAVMTASVSQVRQRIHQNSIGCGNKIKRQLQPFIEHYQYAINEFD